MNLLEIIGWSIVFIIAWFFMWYIKGVAEQLGRNDGGKKKV